VCYCIEMWYKILFPTVVILSVIALIVWVSQVHPVFASTNGSGLPSFSLSTFTPQDATTSEQSTLPTYNGLGVVFIDVSSGMPGTPYIAYETPKHTLGVKELLFLHAGEQGCQVDAGQYPCAPDTNDNNGYASDASPVPSGTPVTLIGGVDDQGVVVQNLQATSTLPDGMVRFSVPLGGTTTLSNGTSITPTEILTDASCTVLVGCYGANTPRVVTTLTANNSTTHTEFIPGNVIAYRKTSIILLSVTGSGNTGVANFLASGN
jgi:hypothetical protein